MFSNKAKEMKEKEETKEEKFKRIASRRVKDILYKLRLLGNCSNTNVYSYADEDRKKIFSSIEGELKRIKSFFDDPKSKEEEFSL